MRPGRSLGVLILAMVLLAGFIQAAGASAKVRKGPAGLDFYDPPKQLPRHGHAIWKRKPKGLVPLDNAASTKLILYTSSDSRGKRTAASGSVSVPEGDPPKRGWPLISYAHGTTGVADACAPSRNRAGGLAETYISYVDSQLEEWLEAGYAVARTDYQGLGTPGPHPYLIGKPAGDDVVDIARAARKLYPKIGRRYLIAGHSQGGHAALFAAGEAEDEAPGMKLRATVSYAPASHILEQAQLLSVFTSPSALTAEAALVVSGAAAVSDQVKPELLLSDRVLALYPQLEKVCLPQLSAPDSLGGIPPASLPRSNGDPDPLFDLLAEINPLVSSAAPILLAQGSADTTVFQLFTDRLNRELTDAGNRVSYRVYKGVDHSGVVAAAEMDVLAFFQSRLPSRR